MNEKVDTKIIRLTFKRKLSDLGLMDFVILITFPSNWNPTKNTQKHAAGSFKQNFFVII